MRLQRLVGGLLACAMLCGAGHRAAAAEATTVALTFTKSADSKPTDGKPTDGKPTDGKPTDGKPADGKPADGKPAVTGLGNLGENLAALTELALQTDDSLAVVERRQIELVVQELILDASRPGKSQLELGKLITADFLAMLETLPPDNDPKKPDSKKPWARLRVVDPKNGAIRGVTVAGLDEETIEETAAQFARYVSAVVRAPEKPLPTLAVAPLVSKGRFDRLRPLELGLRDLITTRLLELSGAAPVRAESGGVAKDDSGKAKPVSFQVLQRSNLDQLLRELELVESGLSDKSRLPDKLPTRAGAYLVQGEIDERQEGNEYQIVVRSEIIDAVTRRVVGVFEFACAPRDLERQLADQVDHLVGRLPHDLVLRDPPQFTGTLEVDSLKQLTLAELRRIRRVDPIRHGRDLFFALPGQNRYENWAGDGKYQPRSPLLLHLLRKSIDRLESVLFINPDDAEAAYALGFCYSIHEPNIYRPERADELLRKTFSLGPDTELANLALEYLAQIDFDDRTGKLIEGHEAQAAERIWFAFANKPVEKNSQTWRLLELLGKLHKRHAQSQALAELIQKAAPLVENAPAQDRKKLAMVLEDLAVVLVKQARRQPALKAVGFELLSRWADGNDQELAYWGRQGLAAVAAVQKDFVAAAGALEASAALIVDLNTPTERDRRDGQLVEAAKLYRDGGDPERALKLLNSFQVRFPTEINRSKPDDDLPGKYYYEVGRCYEILGDREKALAAFLHAAEINPTIISSSHIDSAFDRLGGYPLDPKRDVDVKYYEYPPNFRVGPRPTLRLVADGQKLYLGSAWGVHAFDVASGSWQPTSFPSREVTCLAAYQGQLLAGTKTDGLWQCDLASGTWQRACPLDRLPDSRIVSMAIDGGDIYLGVGSKTSGGLVRIDADRNAHVFDQANAPSVAPEYIVLAKHRIYASTDAEIFEWQDSADGWLRKSAKTLGHTRPTRLFAGKSTIWASQSERELVDWRASKEENERFRRAWCIPENNASWYVRYVQGGYDVLFLTEHDDELWFGGEPWVPLLSAGLYRYRLKTGEFHMFSPADGFKIKDSNYQSMFDGLWLNDRLWITTDQGLCVVTPTKNPSDAHLGQGK